MNHQNRHLRWHFQASEYKKLVTQYSLVTFTYKEIKRLKPFNDLVSKANKIEIDGLSATRHSKKTPLYGFHDAIPFYGLFYREVYQELSGSSQK